MSKQLDLRSNYKRNGIVQQKTRDVKRQETFDRYRNKRANAFNANRNISEIKEVEDEVKEVKQKKLPWAERYRIWKQEKDKMRELEKEKKKKAKPAFKPVGAGTCTQSYMENNKIFKNPTKIDDKASNKVQNSFKNSRIECTNSKNKIHEITKNKIIDNAIKDSRFNTRGNIIKPNNTNVAIKRNIQNKTVNALSKQEIKNSPAKNNIKIQNKKLNFEYSSKDNSENKGKNQVIKKSDIENTFIEKFAPKAESLDGRKLQSQNSPKEVNTNTPQKLRIVNEHNSSLLITPSTRVLRSQGSRGKENVFLSNDIDKASDTEKVNNLSQLKTPSKQEEIPEYVSPFVTVSRGKQSMRKEKLRRSSVIPYAEDNSPLHHRVQAEYYRNIVRNETARLMKLHDTWLDHKNKNALELSEDAKENIDVALGQTKLLIGSKFEQFKDLIEQCTKIGQNEKKILPSDLSAFWDMIFIQVTNIDKRFDRLEKLKTNAWIDVLTPREIKRKPAKSKTEKNALVKKGPQKSQLRDHIRATRKKLQEKKTPNKRTSNIHLNKSITGRGILRTPGLNKSLNSSKTVLFRQSDCNEIIDFDETLPTQEIRIKNNCKPKESINLITWDSPKVTKSLSNTSTPRSTIRRSGRINRGILS